MTNISCAKVMWARRGQQPNPWGWGGYLKKFNTGRLHPEVQPLTFNIPFWQKRYPLYIPLQVTLVTLEHCTPFLSPCNKVNEQYYGRISIITRRNATSASIRNILIKGLFKNLNDQLPYPFIYLNLWNPYPFIYLKPEKGTLWCGASPYRPL